MPLIRDEDQPSTASVQVLSDGTLQLLDVTSRSISSFTCVVPVQDDARHALAETFAITLQGLCTGVIPKTAVIHIQYILPLPFQSLSETVVRSSFFSSSSDSCYSSVVTWHGHMVCPLYQCCIF